MSYRPLPKTSHVYWRSTNFLIICLPMTHRRCSTVHQPTFLGSRRPSPTVLQTSAAGVPRSACSWMPVKPKFFGSDLQSTWARCHQARVSCAPVWLPSTQQPSCVTLESCLTPSYQCARMSVEFFHLCRLRPMRARLYRPRRHLVLIVTALVISRLDYCNCVLAGLPATTVAPLQRVLHADARLVNGLRPHDHVTSAHKELHWLPIKQRVDYKLCLLVHKVTVRQAPSYLTGMLTAVTEVPSRSTLCDA